MCEDDLKDKRKLPPGSIYLNFPQSDDDYLGSLISSADYEKSMRELDAEACSKRAERMRWVNTELPKLARKVTSIGYPLGPWIIPYDQAKNCYIYGFYRATIVMVGSITESICLTLLHTIIGHKDYEGMTLGGLIGEIKKDINLNDENISHLDKIRVLRNKWVHIKCDNWFTDMQQALEKEDSETKADAETLLILIHKVLGSIFEIRPSETVEGAVRIHINAQRKN